MKHHTPDWMDEFLEREEFEDLEELYEFLGEDREEFWREFWEDPTRKALAERVREAERLDEFAGRYEDVVRGREGAVVKVSADLRRALVRIRRVDGVVQTYWLRVERLGEYRVAPKSGYLWRPRRR
jgi:hypothetical protein